MQVKREAKTFVSLRLEPVEDNWLNLSVVSTITGEVIIKIGVTTDTLKALIENIELGMSITETVELGAFVKVEA